MAAVMLELLRLAVLLLVRLGLLGSRRLEIHHPGLRLESRRLGHHPEIRHLGLRLGMGSRRPFLEIPLRHIAGKLHFGNNHNLHHHAGIVHMGKSCNNSNSIPLSRCFHCNVCKMPNSVLVDTQAFDFLLDLAGNRIYL